MRVLLASASKRRLSCLEEILDFEIKSQPLLSEEKSMINGESVELQVNEICLSKAIVAAAEWNIIEKEGKDIPDIIIVSDTIVEDPDNYLNPMGQPKDDLQATNMLLKLSGKRHKVWSSTAILIKNNEEYLPLHGKWKYLKWTNYSIVEFDQLADEDIITLIRSKSWVGKAGGYDLAGEAKKYTKLIQGDELTVLGFAFEAIEELKRILI
jgi:septum formation protein